MNLFLHFQEDEQNFLRTASEDPGDLPDQATLQRLRDHKEHRRNQPTPTLSRPDSPHHASDDDDQSVNSAPGGPDDSSGNLSLNLSLDSVTGVLTRSQRGAGSSGGAGGSGFA